mmetsp:Transcript_4667/g.13205  ORF Transcript_4667/g.13205 Transcript_4667/m.13205 type:complete len:252 (+) Transcript_4667:101-856(+)
MSSVSPPAAASVAAAAEAPFAAAVAAASSVSDEEDDGDFRKVPFFTAKEEWQEIASLTLADIVKVQSDLSGLSSVLVSLQSSASASAGSGLVVGSNNTAAAASLSAKVAIAQTFIEMPRLPPSSTEAYHRAVERCPDQVGPGRTLMFLEAENYDARAAAAKLAKYWEGRVAVFGEERAYLPMSLGGAMKDEAMNLATRGIWQLLTATDTAGRAILYFYPAKRNFAEYSIEQEYVSFHTFGTCLVYVLCWLQ